MKQSQRLQKYFLKRNLQRDSSLESKFDDQFQITIQLQLPINSVSKTEDHCKYLINKNWTLAAMLFLLSDGSVSSIGQQNKSMNMRTPS